MSYSELSSMLSEAELSQFLAETLPLVEPTAEQQPSKAIWTPIPDSPQQAAYESEADELFYGGAAGGGKTDLLLGLAGTRHHRSIIFRRIFPSVRGIIERSREIYNRAGDAHAKDSYNESLHLWRLADDRNIEFGSMQLERDKEKHRGLARDLYGFDEITEFTESQYRFVTAWNRSTKPDQRCRVVATGNPPATPEGEWVKQYWGAWLDPNHPNPARHGELRWYVRIDDRDVELEGDWRGRAHEHNGETLQPRSRTFIPARLADNPFLRDTGYLAIVQSLPEPLRSQMLYGDFAGTTKDDVYQTIPTAWVEAAMNRVNDRANSMTALGVDVARGGSDKTVLAPLYGFVFGSLTRIAGKDTPNGSAVVQHIISAGAGDAPVGIDVIGVGASAYDSAVGVCSAIAVNFAEGTDATDKSGKLRFRNVRAAAYWAMREALDPITGANLTLPDDPELKSDLCAPRWSLSGGRILIEDKDDIKKRIGRSPDAGDAVVIANYVTQISVSQIFM